MFFASRKPSRSCQTTRRFAGRIEQLESRNLNAALTMGGIVSGHIGDVGEKDSWTFSGKAGDQVELIMTSSATKGAFSAYGTLVSQAGNTERWFNYDVKNVVHTLKETGTYTFEVKDRAEQHEGDYRIGLERTSPISPNPVPLIKGGIVGGTINSIIEKDQFTFHAAARSKVELILTSSATRGVFDACAVLFAPSGNPVKWWKHDVANVEITLPNETGNYMLQVIDADYDATGSYTVGLESISPFSPNPRELPRNSTVEGEINNVIEKDQLVFRGVANETVDITLTNSPDSPNFDAYVVVYAPSGNAVRWWKHDQLKVSVTLPNESGRYMLQVFDAGYDAVGDYTVKLEGTPLPTTVATPTNLRAANVWTDKIDLNWDDKATNETGYKVSASFDGGESWVTVGQTGANARSFRVNYLAPGQAYKFKVQAFNGETRSNYSNVITVTTRLISPINLVAANVWTTTLDLNWTDKSNNETRFEIFRRATGTTTWTKVASTSANATSFRVTGLTAGKKYEFVVRAANSTAYSAMSNLVSVTMKTSV